MSSSQLPHYTLRRCYVDLADPNMFVQLISICPRMHCDPVSSVFSPSAFTCLRGSSHTDWREAANVAVKVLKCRRGGTGVSQTTFHSWKIIQGAII